MQELAVLAGLGLPSANKEVKLLFLESQSNVWVKLCLHRGAPEISSGLRMSVSMGMMWRVMRRCSRVFELGVVVMWDGRVPRWVESSM